jgi:site-specific DNA-cytosine methylase
MRVLVACEESQEVCKAFRALGHEAYSCDLQECSGGHPEWHIQGDALTEVYFGNYDLLIAHPPCTYFSRAGYHFIYKKPERKTQLVHAFSFVLALWHAPVPLIALENPIGLLNTNWRKPNQIIHPWYFGDGEMKETCLWLKGLPRLQGSMEIAMNPKAHHPKPEKSRIGSDGKMKNKYFMGRAKNAKERSKTFPGIARAMAEQWGGNLNQKVA